MNHDSENSAEKELVELRKRLEDSERKLREMNSTWESKLRYAIRGMQVTNRELAKSNTKLVATNEILRELRISLETKTKELEHSKSEAELLARTDALTGLSNRRNFFETAHDIFAQAKQDNIPITVVMVDIDYFKIINDTYGHSAGDVVIKNIASILKKDSQVTNVARLGGEEFALLLPKIELPEALVKVNCLRTRVADTQFLHDGQEISVTASFGLSLYRDAEVNLEELIHRADQALYTAKREGRNRIKVFDQDNLTSYCN